MSQDTGNQAAAETSSEEMPQANSRYVKTLLVVVIGLGVLLVVGAVVVISTIISRISNPETVPRKTGFGQTEIAIPVDAELIDVENGATRIVLRLRDEKGPLLIMLDPRKGVETGRVRLQEQ